MVKMIKKDGNKGDKGDYKAVILNWRFSANYHWKATQTVQERALILGSKDPVSSSRTKNMK